MGLRATTLACTVSHTAEQLRFKGAQQNHDRIELWNGTGVWNRRVRERLQRPRLG